MTPKSVYLVLYNSIQVSLWSAVLVYLIAAFKNDFPFLHNATALEYATRAQTFAWLEVIHAAVGFGGGISTAFVQCLGRFVVLAFVINAVPPIQHTILTSLLLLSWSVADVIRYSFYISSFVGGPGKVVLWLRYSMFLILYPLGITSEWLVYYHTLDFIDSTSLYRIELPNSWNFAFDFGTWNRFVLTLYFYFGPYMFLHMVRQRKRKLS